MARLVHVGLSTKQTQALNTRTCTYGDSRDPNQGDVLLQFAARVCHPGWEVLCALGHNKPGLSGAQAKPLHQCRGVKLTHLQPQMQARKRKAAKAPNELPFSAIKILHMILHIHCWLLHQLFQIKYST